LIYYGFLLKVLKMIPNITAIITHTGSPNKNLAEARLKTLALYRDSLRIAPFIVKNFELDVSSSLIKDKITAEFRRNSNLKDLSTIDNLQFTARTDIEETKALWKQKPHIMQYFGLSSKQNLTKEEISELMFTRNYDPDREYRVN